MTHLMSFISALIGAGTVMYILSMIVPKFRGETTKKSVLTVVLITVFYMLGDERLLRDVLLFYGMIMLLLQGVYKTSSFVAGMGTFFLFIIQLLSAMITGNIATMLLDQHFDFRAIVGGAPLSCLLLYAVCAFVLTLYYKRAIKVFQNVNHLTRRLERLLVISNIVVFTFIIGYHRMAFSSLIKVAVSNGAVLNAVDFYLFSSYVLATVLSFTVVVLINRLFIVDYSMEDYKFKAETDLMTGTLSREAGLNHLRREMTQVALHGGDLTVAYIDINDLKKVNDIQGHKAGDLMIKTITGIVHDNLRHRDEISRLGGDEFMVVFKKCNIEQAAKVWMRINDAFTAVNRSAQYSFTVSASVGFVQYDPLVHRDMNHLLHEADEKMYAYKKKFKQKAL